VITVEPNCEPVGCYTERRVEVHGNLSVGICAQVCEPPTFTPPVAPPGGIVDLVGRCLPSKAGERLTLSIVGEVIGEVVVEPDGTYRASVAAPPIMGVHVTVELRDDQGPVAAAALPIANALIPCVGDCDSNGVVTVGEIVLGVRIVLGLAPVSACPRMDDSDNGSVTVAELIAALDRLLDGCRAADLVPISATFSRCIERNCHDRPPSHFMHVCIENQGDDTAGSFYATQGSYPPVFVPGGISPGQQRCFELPFESHIHVTLDVNGDVPERDETNNVLDMVVPFPTACDVLPPPCTPTPTGVVTPSPIATPT
jgi:hypothetical protein